MNTKDTILEYLRSKMGEQNPTMVSQKMLDKHSSKTTTHGEPLVVGDCVYFFVSTDISAIKVITFVERELEFIAELYDISEIVQHKTCLTIKQN